MSSKLCVIVTFVLAGLFWSCKDDPSSPPEQTRTVTISAPKTGLAFSTYTFKASLNFVPQAGLQYKWKIDSTPVMGDSIHWSFSTAGIHIIRVEAQNQSGIPYCSAIDTFTIVQTPLLKIEPDSIKIESNAKVTFRFTVQGFELPKSYRALWLLDNNTIETKNQDTLSYAFWKAGIHTVAVTLMDSSGRALLSGRATVWDTDRIIVPPNPGDTSSHDFVWTETSLPNTNVTETNATGCWVFGPNCIYALNWYLYRYSDGTWAKVPLYDNSGKELEGLSGRGLFAFDTNDFWLTGASGTMHYHGNGRVDKYSTFYLNHGYLRSAWGTSSSNMYFVGDSGLIVHLDGQWTKMQSPTTLRLDAIWGLSDHDIWASGYDNGKSELLHYDGVSWARDPLSTAGIASSYGLDGVFESDSVGHKALVIAGSTVFRKTDSGEWWKDASVPNGDHIGIAIAGQTTNDFFAVGGWGVVSHWNGSTWKQYTQFYAPGALGYGAGASSYRKNTLCVVGVKNGTSWVLIGQRQ